MKVEPLLKAVSTILPACDTKGLVKDFSYLYFSKNHVEATDGSMFIRANLEEEYPEFQVDAETFHALLRTVKDKELNLAITDKAIVLKCKSVKTELQLPANKPQAQVDFEVAEWQDVPEGLLEALALCRFTACSDQTAGPLTGVRVEGDTVISCDRWRVSLYNLSKSANTMTLPATLIDQLSRFSKKIQKYAVKGDTIYFDLGDAKVGGKLLQGEFPTEKLLSAFSQLDDAVKIPLSKELKDSITEAGKRQNIIQSQVLEFDRQSKITLANGKLVMYAQNSSVGTIEETLDCDKAKDVSFEFYINPQFLLQTFEQADEMLYSASNSVVAFSGKSFMHLVKTKCLTMEEGK